MIDLFTFKEDLKKKDFKNCYVFCGSDENIIQECVKLIVDRFINPDFLDLNYIKFDGNSMDGFQPVINACQTLPFMSNKKIVLVYRANFIGNDLQNKSKLSGEKEFNYIHKYVKKVPEHCILIMYEVFKSKRDKVSKRIYKLDKDVCVVRIDKFKGRQLENRVEEIFSEKNKEIKKFELRLFCSVMEDNNFSVIKNEVEKLCCYTYGREITKDDIKKLFLKTSDDDIFDLVNPISNKKIKESLIVLDELMYKGVNINYILTMIERQFNLLFKMKKALEDKKDKKYIMNMLRMKSDYAYSIMMSQSKKFTLRQLRHAVDLCINSEQKIKSSTVDQKTEIELLIINTIAG
ncbi:DNA polymerase III subunit delta [Clostridium tyrobutyricum]|uniref:DNA polymerase III subunit delta n=1 Tax=Clostridium tyrobutyricum TaxID=1519 RepID=UPI001C3917AC|nr:DNA polymerase III subunit delta [Clostridium tyrobutyricum]MBV4415030.1 DNA polymerase III subunit delta [Clostridium tyrobutyricum]